MFKHHHNLYLFTRIIPGCDISQATAVESVAQLVSGFLPYNSLNRKFALALTFTSDDQHSQQDIPHTSADNPRQTTNRTRLVNTKGRRANCGGKSRYEVDKTRNEIN